MQTWRAWSDVSEPITLAAAVVQHCFATKLECQQYMVAFLSLQSLQLLVFCDRGSVLAPLLFNIYISDLPTTVSRKYAYVDDLTITHAGGDWQAVERVLSKDMATVGEYLRTWKLKLSTIKTMSAAFHLNSKEAKRELKVNYNNETLPFCSEPKYLGVTLDRSLTYHRHLESFRRKLISRVALLRRLTGVLEQQLCE